MEVNAVGFPVSARLAARESIARSTSRNWLSWAGSADPSNASPASRPRDSAPPGTNASARAMSTAISRSDQPGATIEVVRWRGGVGGARCGSSFRALPALGGPRLAPERPVLSVSERAVGLDQGVELAGPLVDDGSLRVAQVALHREFVRVAVGAVDLDGVEGALHRVLGGVPLGEAGLARIAQALVLEPGRPPDEQPAHLGPGRHLGDHLLDQLVLADLLSEGVPLVGVAHRCVETRLGKADRTSRDREPTLVDRAHRDRKTLALLADPVLDRDRHVVEIDQPRIARPDPELAVERAGRQPGHPALEHEGGHALVLLAPVDRGEDQEMVGDVRQRDPDLLAVEPVRVAVAAG